MPRQIAQKPPPITCISLYFRLFYKEAQYWLLGLTPEHYHHYQAVILSKLHRFDRAIHHYRAYLRHTDNPHVRATMGTLLGTVERWPEALIEYERAALKWSHPAVKLAIAEVHLRLGQVAECRRHISLVDVEYPQLDSSLNEARRQLLVELESGA
jgi:tetratricopeptide (TPR) repeat protein